MQGPQDVHDVIIAVASPPARSRRGIVRISGEACFALCDQLIILRNGSRVAAAPRGIHRAVMRLGEQTLPVLALLFPGCASYTGEPSIEVQMPGNPSLLARMIDAVINMGAARGIAVRRAEPGEFTARAFMSGRLSLTEAEGVAAAIAAQNDAALRAAHQLLSGRIGGVAQSLGDDLAGALSLVEAGIDFTDEEDVVAIDAPALRARLTSLAQKIERELQRAVGTESLNDAPWVVLTGPPNAGKSTLFNALLGRQRAVVSDVAGTTRDVLVEPMHVPAAHGEAEVMLVDVAGEDDAGHDVNDDNDEVDRAMQRARIDAAGRAELVLRCAAIDADHVAAKDQSGDAAREITVRTKADLSPGRAQLLSGDESGFAVSAVNGAGLSALRCAIGDALAQRAVSLTGDMIALRPRHEAALRAALEHLREARATIDASRDLESLPHPELIASSLRAALDALRELAGDITPDDVLGRIFATFCIGK